MLRDDVLRVGEKQREQWFRRQAVPDGLFERAIVFRIDNVAEYYYHGEKHGWNFSDIPYCVLPFDAVWTEFAFPSATREPPDVRQIGHLMQSEKQEDGWTVRIFQMVETWNRKLAMSGGDYVFGVDDLGNIRSWITRVYDPLVSDGWRPLREDIALQHAADSLFPTLLALSFLHCKNVEMIPNEPPALPMTKKRKRHPPRTKYYTLDIKPMQRILEIEGNANKTGLKMALHICRGHFKDYSKGPGLFGRYQGMYWWDSQVRGDRQYGEVIKDYSIDAPLSQGAACSIP